MIRGIDFDVVNAASGPKARLNDTGAAGQRRVQTNRGAFNNENVAPPSVDIQIPNGGRPGAKLTAPALDSALTPRTPRVEPTYMVLPSITMEEMARPSNAGPLEAGASLRRMEVQIPRRSQRSRLGPRCCWPASPRYYHHLWICKYPIQLRNQHKR